MRIRDLLRLLAVVLCLSAPVAGAEPPALSIYGGLPGFEMASMSPSGQKVAIIGAVKNERRLVVVEGSRALFTAALGDIKVRGLYWVGEDTVLISKSDTQQLSRLDFTADKVELSSMLVVALDGKPVWSVFADNKSITGGVRDFFGIRQKDGRYFGYFSAMTYQDNTTGKYLSNTNAVLYEVDFGTHKARRLAPALEGQGHRDWIVGADGEVAATMDFRNGSGDWVIRNREGKRIAMGTSPTGGVSLVGMGATPGTLIYGVEGDEGEGRWFELPATGGEGKEILQDVAIRESFLDRRNAQIFGYVQEGDSGDYKFFEPAKQSVMSATLKAFPGKSVSLEDWDDAFTTLLVRTQGSGDPGTWWQVAVRTGKAVQLGVTFTLRASEVGPVRMVRYKANDGLEIAAVLTLPPGIPEKDLPVIVLPHGGPGARDYPVFDWWAQAFASRGYAVLQPNFRGSTGYGAAFRRAGDGEWGRKMQSDISEGLQHLVASGIADPRRACIVGASYGGYAALAGVTLQKGIYRCAVSVAGIGDLPRMLSTEVAESGSNATLLRVLRKEIGSGRDLQAVSPLRFAESADAPILLIHGRDDTVVRYDQSADMARELQKAGKEVEFVTLAGEDHWLSRSDTRQAMLEATMAFVQKHNPAQPR